MPVTQKQTDWLRWVLLTSIPLRHLDKNGIPDEFASGCLIDFSNRRYLLSVRHSIRRESSGWVIDLGCDSSGNTSIFKPDDFRYVDEVDFDSDISRNIDFCFTEVPSSLISTFQIATPLAISDEKPRHVFHVDQIVMPNPDQLFAFSGQVKPEQHNPRAVVFDYCVYPGLRYIRTEGEFHLFQLPVEHPGHDHFCGCSGAPIIDMNRNIVALVCNGDSSTNIIRGVSLDRYKFIFGLDAVARDA